MKPRPALLLNFYSSNTRKFYAYVFYHRDRDIADSQQSGLSAEIEAAAIDELIAVGRGPREVLDVVTEFDSYENVRRNYGSYFNRLR